MNPTFYLIFKFTYAAQIFTKNDLAPFLKTIISSSYLGNIYSTILPFLAV